MTGRLIIGSVWPELGVNQKGDKITIFGHVKSKNGLLCGTIIMLIKFHVKPK